MDTEKFALPRDFAKNVFNDEVMKDRLPSDVYKELRKTIDNGEDLNEKIARADIPDKEIVISTGMATIEEIKKL